MKKYLLASLLAAGSQFSYAQAVHLGLKAGVNFSRFVGPDVPDDSFVASENSRLGIYAGVLAELELTPHWAVQPELLYSAKGTKRYYFGGASTLYQRLNYLDVPLLLKYKTHHVFVEAGPQLGILLSATNALELSTGTTEEDDKSAFRLLDAGYALGVGVQDTNGLLLGVRYNGGLLNVAPENYRARNSSFQLYVGYLFGSSKP